LIGFGRNLAHDEHSLERRIARSRQRENAGPRGIMQATPLAETEMADNLTPEQRSHCMSRVRNKDTELEILVAAELFRRGLRYRKHVKTLPGTPDLAIPKSKVAVFVDGDFWHGFRFPQWKRKLSPFWRRKIEMNRRRDQRNFAKLRRMGWRVVRIWKHMIKNDLDKAVEKIEKTV
jgi:DNA mismatch endonuclease, patch repair protein